MHPVWGQLAWVTLTMGLGSRRLLNRQPVANPVRRSAATHVRQAAGGQSCSAARGRRSEGPAGSWSIGRSAGGGGRLGVGSAVVVPFYLATSQLQEVVPMTATCHCNSCMSSSNSSSCNSNNSSAKTLRHPGLPQEQETRKGKSSNSSKSGNSPNACQLPPVQQHHQADVWTGRRFRGLPQRHQWRTQTGTSCLKMSA